jgi:ribosome-associated protein
LNPVQSENLARRLAELADSKKAEDIVVLDMRDLVAYTDFLVICTARNERQARAIVDTVLHVFTPEARERYQLEDLWHEAPRLELVFDEPEAPSAAAGA